VNYEQALHKSAAYCSSSEHCISELKEKLDKWEVDRSDQSKIISYLIQEKYMDEVRYAVAFVKDKFRYNKWGKIKIAMALRLKKIASETIADALYAIDEEEYNQMIIRLIKEKDRSIKYNNQYERQAKLLRYMSSKGFETETILRLISKQDT
jgi:regulatory protein